MLPKSSIQTGGETEEGGPAPLWEALRLYALGLGATACRAADLSSACFEVEQDLDAAVYPHNGDIEAVITFVVPRLELAERLRAGATTTAPMPPDAPALLAAVAEKAWHDYVTFRQRFGTQSMRRRTIVQREAVLALWHCAMVSLEAVHRVVLCPRAKSPLTRPPHEIVRALDLCSKTFHVAMQLSDEPIDQYGADLVRDALVQTGDALLAVPLAQLPDVRLYLEALVVRAGNLASKPDAAPDWCDRVELMTYYLLSRVRIHDSWQMRAKASRDAIVRMRAAVGGAAAIQVAWRAVLMDKRYHNSLTQSTLRDKVTTFVGNALLDAGDHELHALVNDRGVQGTIGNPTANLRQILHALHPTRYASVRRTEDGLESGALNLDGEQSATVLQAAAEPLRPELNVGVRFDAVSNEARVILLLQTVLDNILRDMTYTQARGLVRRGMYMDDEALAQPEAPPESIDAFFARCPSAAYARVGIIRICRTTWVVFRADTGMCDMVLETESLPEAFFIWLALHPHWNHHPCVPPPLATLVGQLLVTQS